MRTLVTEHDVVARSAVVTSCSHVFCVDCANTLLGSPPACPACHSILRDEYDLVAAELHPSENFKSTILAGLPPQVVNDIAGRALSFWNYQQSHEKQFQAMLAANAELRVGALEKELGDSRRKHEADTDYLKGQLESARREFDGERRKVQELKQLHVKNAKSYAKLQNVNNELKQQILLGASPMANVELGFNDPTPIAVTSSARRPFVPATNVNVSGRPLSQTQSHSSAHLAYASENYHVGSTSTRSFVSNPERSEPGNINRADRSSSSTERHSADHAPPARSRSRQVNPGGRPGDHRFETSRSTGGGGRIGVDGTTTTTTNQAQRHPQDSHRPSSTSFFAPPTQPVLHSAARGTGTFSAGAFRPAAFGRGGSGGTT